MLTNTSCGGGEGGIVLCNVTKLPHVWGRQRPHRPSPSSCSRLTSFANPHAGRRAAWTDLRTCFSLECVLSLECDISLRCVLSLSWTDLRTCSGFAYVDSVQSVWSYPPFLLGDMERGCDVGGDVGGLIGCITNIQSSHRRSHLAPHLQSA
jgi:hypothetical protein